MSNALFESLPPEIASRRIVDAKHAAAFLSLPLPSFRRAYRHGKAPQPIQISERRLGWRLCDLITWTDARKIGHEQKAAPG
jgi:predicted DNA-binding transcriptional regulator AlpA